MAACIEDILAGFQINWITIRVVDSGEILWHGNQDYSCPDSSHTIYLPKTIFKHRAVTREINFSSSEAWENMKLVQTALYKGIPMDKWVFEYGPVNPNSINGWQTVIEAAPEVDMMSGKILSGNLIVVSEFYNGKTQVSKSKTTVHYV